MSEFAFCSKEDIKDYCENKIKTVAENVKKCLEKGHPRPRLLIIQVGDNPASNKYVNNKIKTCNQSNIEASLVKFPSSIKFEEMKNFIEKERNLYHSVIIQLPLPDRLNKKLDELMMLISPEQDIDGFKYNSKHNPATPAGIISYIESKKGKEWFTGKHAVVIGRSDIVGKPIARMLTDLDCTVTLCHSKTKNLRMHTLLADLIIVAVGKSKMIDSDYFSCSKEQFVFDVGINFDPETGKMHGDVDYDKITDCNNTMEYRPAVYCTPVPFGVGQLTKCQVVKNVWDAYVMQEEVDI